MYAYSYYPRSRIRKLELACLFRIHSTIFNQSGADVGNMTIDMHNWSIIPKNANMSTKNNTSQFSS